MTKVTVYNRFRMVSLLLLLGISVSQLMGQYKLDVRMAAEERLLLEGIVRIPDQFSNRALCLQYLSQLPGKLHKAGFAAASVDSLSALQDRATIHLFLGTQYQFGRILMDASVAQAVNDLGISPFDSRELPLDPSRWITVRDRLLQYYEENGYPFATVGLDSVMLRQGRLEGKLYVQTGPLYKIDSIRNLGSAIISSRFLHRYLGVLPGSVYKKSNLEQISQKLSQLSFLEEKSPWTLTRLATGAVVNVHLEPRKSSQVNVLVGLLPAVAGANNAYEPPRNRFQLTGEANIKLRNAFGGGEVIGLNWQQLQLRSPRLHLLFEQPYLAGSPFGVQFNFDLFKKDSSFLSLNGLVGISYARSSQSQGTLFIQLQQSNLLSIDTLGVKLQKTLPSSGDLRSASIGVNYEFNHTDFRSNPLKGSEGQLVLSAGTKTIKRNAGITALTDQNNPDFQFSSLYDTLQMHTYQLRLKVSGAHFFRISRASTLKAAVQAGWFQSPVVFRNELYQIGGYRLLRGFDEESIYASSYGVATLEFRYLFGRNSHFFVFSDMAAVRNAALSPSQSNTFWGAGMGMMLESKSGILNISLAAGKRNDLPLNLRQAKIHLGYVSFF